MSSHATTYVSFLEAEKGFKSWLTTLDHKRIGLMYMATSMIFFMIGGIFATLVRLELMFPGQTIMSAGTYNKFFTYHGAIMIFMFIIPIIPAALGNFFLPIMIGAKDVAFPRLNLASYYIFIAGASFAVLALMLKGADTGWTFYTPYSIRSGTSVVLVALGVFIMGFSGILTGLNFMTTVHKLRAPGMTFHRMPLFVWAIYATAIIQVLATPVIGITTLLLIMERALGIISEVIPVFSRKHIFGYHAIAYSSLAIAFISFVVWGHHMFVSSQSDLANMLFSFLTMFVAVPTAIKVFNWTATMYKGSISLKTPMLYALSFLFMFTIGGLTGLFLAALSVDVHLHDTYFVVAHFHYVMMGGTVMGMLAGFHYWWPKMFGRMVPERWGKIAWAFIFTGFNVTFLPQFFLGQQGMPRRYHDYLPQYTSLNMISTIGSWMIDVGMLIMLIYFVKSLFFGKRV